MLESPAAQGPADFPFLQLRPATQRSLEDSTTPTQRSQDLSVLDFRPTQKRLREHEPPPQKSGENCITISNGKFTIAV